MSPFEFRYTKACSFGNWHDDAGGKNREALWNELDSDSMETLPGGKFIRNQVVILTC